jgi:hypothetical protein
MDDLSRRAGLLDRADFKLTHYGEERMLDVGVALYVVFAAGDLREPHPKPCDDGKHNASDNWNSKEIGR